MCKTLWLAEGFCTALQCVTGRIKCGVKLHHKEKDNRVALVTAPPSYTPRMYHYFPAHMTHPFCYYPSLAPQQARYPGLFMRPDETNLYTTLEQTMSSNPNVYFQRGGGVHPGMMY
uniref:Uncharacterized protein n=1 Tax=Anopheles epiroticus TaxID=199890 RepID=A0A182PWE0_9DIPT